MTLRLSKWFFLLLVVSLPLVRPFSIYFSGMLIPYTDFIFLASFAFWGLAAIQRKTTVQIDRMYIFVGLYGLAFTVSALFSIDPKTSFIKLLGEYYLFGLSFLTFNLVRDTEFLKRVVGAWTIGTGLTILASIAGFVLYCFGYKTLKDNYFLFHFGSLPPGNYPRIMALFDNPNMLSNYLNVSVMLIFVAERLRLIKRSLAVVLGLGILFATAFSISPGLGGVALSLGLWFWVIFSARSKMRLAIPALAIGVIIAIGVFGSALVSIDTDNTSQDFTIPLTQTKIEPSVRVLLWENTLETVRQYPWLGIGTGVDVANVRYYALSGGLQILTDAHNMWLNILAQTGTLGLAALMTLLAYLIKQCRFRIRDGGDGQYIRVALSCAFVGAFLYQGLAGSFEDTRHLWILVGLLVASSVYDFNETKIDISAELNRV